MPTVNDLKKSRFLTKSDVARPLLLTIKGWHQENVAVMGEPEELKYCLDFEEVDKPLVLNTTKGNIIAKIAGAEDFDGWTGVRIVVELDPNVMMAGRLVGGIGIRAPKLNVPGVAPIAPAPKPTGPRPPTPRPAPAPPVPAPVPSGEDDGGGEGDDVPF